LAAGKIVFDQLRGRKDRYILCPQAFALVLRARLTAKPNSRLLFETHRRGAYIIRRVQQSVQRSREVAGLSAAVHLRLFRHQRLIFLTGEHLSDAPLQLISAHACRTSLEV